MIGDISTIKIKFNFRVIIKFVHTYELNLKFRLETSVSAEFIYRTWAITSRGFYIFTPFFTAVYIVERLILQTIYVLNKEILEPKIRIQERFQIKSG